MTWWEWLVLLAALAIAGVVLFVLAMLTMGVLHLVGDRMRRCPECAARGLRFVTDFRANPGRYSCSLYQCGKCRGHYKQTFDGHWFKLTEEETRSLDRIPVGEPLSQTGVR